MPAGRGARGTCGFQEMARTWLDDGHGLEVGEVTLRDPDGAVIRRRYLHTPDVVAIVAIHADELVLIREFRAAVGEEVLQVPMGKVPAGTDSSAQALLELREETGFQADQCDPVATLLACPGWMDQRMHVFRASGLVPNTARVPSGDDVEEKHSRLERLPLADVNEMIRSGVLIDARTIAAIRLAIG